MIAQMDVDGSERAGGSPSGQVEDLICRAGPSWKLLPRSGRVTTAVLRPQRDLPTIFFSLSTAHKRMAQYATCSRRTASLFYWTVAG